MALALSSFPCRMCGAKNGGVQLTDGGIGHSSWRAERTILPRKAEGAVRGDPLPSKAQKTFARGLRNARFVRQGRPIVRQSDIRAPDRDTPELFPGDMISAWRTV